MADQSSNSSNSGSGAIKSQLLAKFQKNKHLVLKLHSVLTWERDYYSFALGGATTFVFLLISYLNASILTTLSLLGMVSAMLDYSLPMITKSLCDTSKWTEKDAQKLDKICSDLAKSYAFVKSAYDSLSEWKQTKPNRYYGIILSFFTVAAWFGAQFNNLFLTYLFVILVVLYPGLEKKNVPQKIYETLMSKIRSSIPSSSSGDRKQSTGRKSS